MVLDLKKTGQSDFFSVSIGKFYLLTKFRLKNVNKDHEILDNITNVSRKVLFEFEDRHKKRHIGINTWGVHQTLLSGTGGR